MNNKKLEAFALSVTKANVVKTRSTTGVTYLSRFVDLLNGIGEDGALTRVEIISKLSLQIAVETFEDFNFENEEHAEFFAETNRKAKSQVAAAISNSNNNTSLSYNDRFKDKYELNEGKNERGVVYWITEKVAE